MSQDNQDNGSPYFVILWVVVIGTSLISHHFSVIYDKISVLEERIRVLELKK